MLSKRGIGMIACPCHDHVDEGEMGDVERITDLAQKFVDRLWLTSNDTTACADADDEGEGNEDAQITVGMEDDKEYKVYIYNLSC